MAVAIPVYRPRTVIPVGGPVPSNDDDILDANRVVKVGDGRMGSRRAVTLSVTCY